jgi:hypothetical protein
MLHQNMSGAYKVCYIALQCCVRVGGDTCAYSVVVLEILTLLACYLSVPSSSVKQSKKLLGLLTLEDGTDKLS